MCKECGCDGFESEDSNSGHGTRDHDHPHTHKNPDGTEFIHIHDHVEATGHSHAGSNSTVTRTVKLETRVLALNDRIAAENRIWLAKRGTIALNLISSPGTGKTLLLEKTIMRLRDRIPIAVIAADQHTDNDKRRLATTGVPVEQIETESSCHLDAGRVAAVLPGLVRPGIRLLFIENIGNLVCPAAFDLGETFKVALLSTTEGEDKPVKYPALFTAAQVVVLTKTDLIPHLDWDLAKCRKYIQSVHPGVFVFEVSAKTGDGMDLWCNYLERLLV